MTSCSWCLLLPSLPVNREQSCLSISRGRERLRILTDDADLLARRVTDLHERKAAVELQALRDDLAKLGFLPQLKEKITSQGVEGFCEDFPHSHNLVLIGQPPLLQSLALSINEEIRSRVTYSVVLLRLSPETIEQFILSQLDRAGLGHNTFTAEALALIVRSGEGLLRRTRNLSLSSLIEAVRDQTRIVDLKQVNRVLVQPHWRKDCDTPLLS